MLTDTMIKRTFDAELVRSIIGDDELHKRAGKHVPVDVYDPENQKELYYLSVENETEVVGVIIFHIFNHAICYQGHVNYLPKYWGSGLAEHTREAIQWMFDNTDCLKVIALAPDTYPEVYKHAIKTGLKSEGYLKKSIMINGKLDNQTIFGIEK